jgi:hypothetical protein
MNATVDPQDSAVPRKTPPVWTRRFLHLSSIACQWRSSVTESPPPGSDASDTSVISVIHPEPQQGMIHVATLNPHFKVERLVTNPRSLQQNTCKAMFFRVEPV